MDNLMANPYKILLLDTGKEWGGGTNSLLELLKRIDRQRFQISCVFYYNYARGPGENIESVCKEIGIPIDFLPQRTQPIWAKMLKEGLRAVCFFSRAARKYMTQRIDQIWRIRPYALKISQILQHGQYDCLYMNNQPLSNVEGYWAAAMAKKPILQHCRIEPSLPSFVVNLLNQSAGRVIGVSYGVVETLVKAGVEAKKCTVVLNGIDPTQPLPSPDAVRQRYQLNDFIFGAVGSLITRKGIHFLLAAAAKLDRSCAWKILLVGEGPQKPHLIQQAQALGIADRVIFAGFQPQPLPYIAAMDVCMLCSAQEGLPRILLEAMLLEKPIIASAVTGSREVVRHEQTGLLVPYADVPALTHAMQTLLTSAKRHTWGKAGRKVVETEYTITQYVHGVETILDEVCTTF
jgi:glycosyltransferase involved in cell wall biosynthesis